jgi:hypothetical protein
MYRAIRRDPRAATITTHELALWRRTLRRARRSWAIRGGVQRVNYLTKELEIRADTGIDQNEDQTNEEGDNQVLQSASSFIAGPVVAAATEKRRVSRTAARHRIARAAARLRFLRPSIETSGRQATTMNSFFEDAGNLLRESAMFGSSAAAQRFLQVIRNVCTDKNPFSISHLSSPSLGSSGLPCNSGTGL